MGLPFKCNFKLLCFLLIYCLALTACNSSASKDSTISGLNLKLLNGQPIADTDVPQLVKVYTHIAGAPGLCTGIILDSKHALTAAHCVVGASALAIEKSTVITPVVSVAIHPGYFESSEVSAIFNDVAILEFENLSLPALPILVSEDLSVNNDGVLYGYGIDNSGSAGSLRGGLVTLEQVTVNHLIGSKFTGKNSNPCNGDSGAPLLISVNRPEGILTGIVGIVSTGTSPDCGNGDVTFYINLQNPDVLNFILNQVPGVSVQ